MSLVFSDQPEGRYDRQALIPWWDQARLGRAHFIVAGAGALGNEVLKLLALMGAGRITIVDFDVISASNLARMVLFRESDIGRPKVTAAVERLRELNPQVQVHGVQGDLRFDLSLGMLRRADLVFGCLDSINARWALNRRCLLAGVDWIDGGISDHHGLVAHYSPRGGACYECTFTAATLERFNRRYSCPYGLAANQVDQAVPTTAITTSVIAALQVQQALLWLHGQRDQALQPGERLLVYLKPYRMLQDRLPANPGCLAHARLPEEIPSLPLGSQATLRQVLHAAQSLFPRARALDLPYDLVTHFTCLACGAEEAVVQPKEKVYNDAARCPRCGGARQPHLAGEIGLDEALADMPLQRLGVAPGEVLCLRTDQDESVFVELANEWDAAGGL